MKAKIILLIVFMLVVGCKSQKNCDAYSSTNTVVTKSK
jgi:uncharacterized protein YcfL